MWWAYSSNLRITFYSLTFSSSLSLPTLLPTCLSPYPSPCPSLSLPFSLPTLLPTRLSPYISLSLPFSLPLSLPTCLSPLLIWNTKVLHIHILLLSHSTYIIHYNQQFSVTSCGHSSKVPCTLTPAICTLQLETALGLYSLMSLVYSGPPPSFYTRPCALSTMAHHLHSIQGHVPCPQWPTTFVLYKAMCLGAGMYFVQFRSFSRPGHILRCHFREWIQHGPRCDWPVPYLASECLVSAIQVGAANAWHRHCRNHFCHVLCIFVKSRSLD